MGRDIAMPFLVTIVFWNVMKIISSDNNGSLHLGRDNNSLENLASDGDTTSEGTLLIDIVRLNGLLGSTESKSNILVVSHS